jgi:hypothetical protein
MFGAMIRRRIRRSLTLSKSSVVGNTSTRQRKHGVYVTVEDVATAEEHFQPICDENDLNPLEPKSLRRVHVSRTAIEKPVTYVVDHMRFLAIDRVTKLIPLETIERIFHGRYDKRFCMGEGIAYCRTLKTAPSIRRGASIV